MPPPQSARVANRPSHFAVPVFHRWLVHFPLHRVSALLDQEAMRHLLALESDADDRVGVLSGLRRDLATPPANRPEPKAGAFDPSYLALVTTRGCNIKCVYCDFGGPTSNKVFMDPAIAVAAIDWMAEQLERSRRDRFSLHLFGGEPLIAGRLVDIAVYRLRHVCAARGLTPFVDVSTNGVMSLERARWVGNFLDSVVLSLDGPPMFHDRNRPGKGGQGTFAIVDRTAKYLSSTTIELCLRACVTRESVLELPQITQWMIESYRPAMINFEPLTENDLSAQAGLGAPDPYDYVRMWMAAKRIADHFGVPLVYSATEADVPRLSSCPVGSDAVIVAPDGAVNGCYLQPADWLRHGMDMSLGRVSGEGGVEIRADRAYDLRHAIVDKPRCRSCLAQWSCAGGCHVSNTYRNCPDGYNDYCLQTRLITVCLLLDDLGEAQLVDALLQDADEMRRVAEHPSDAVGRTSRSSWPPVSGGLGA